MKQLSEIVSRAEEAYEAGDFRTARKLARQAVSSGEPSFEIAERAARILRATGVDPVAIVVFAITAVLLLYLIVRYVF